MTIDWITVSAQIVNFLILVWLLKHFLYQPVMRAMERREQRIAKRLDEAQEREQNADEKVQRYQEQRDELQRQHDTLMDEAREEAKREKRQLLDEAREEVAETRANWQRQANQEKQEFFANLRIEAAEAVQHIARMVLRDLADTELEERIVQTFIEQLKSLDKDTRKVMAHTVEPMRIASAFELDSAVRGRLTRAVHEYIADGKDVEYSESPELLCGIELTSGGQRLSWNLQDYMEELAVRIEEAFSMTDVAREEE
ncbi:MAG: hypothetical protein PVF52_03550 [Granulosicoccaceae bacterium]|jgi:F-type H+-transporting ATPase subunit b